MSAAPRFAAVDQLANRRTPGRPLTAPEAKRLGHAAARGRFLRMPDVIATTGLSRPTIYRLIDRNEFPRQQQLTARCVGWWESDVEAWLETRLNPPA